jgi:Helix-turn-helix
MFQKIDDLKEPKKFRKPRPKTRNAFAVWSKEECAALRALFPRAKWPQILDALPGRARSAIRQKARLLRVRREISQRPRWTADECVILRREYAIASDEDLKRQLPKHSLIAIQRQACAIGIEIRPRKEAREQKRFVHPLIAKLYQERRARRLPRQQFAKTVGCTHGAILSWELGKTIPDFQNVVAWAQALGFEFVLRPIVDMKKSVDNLVIPYPDRKRLMGAR